jgi:rhodanese-related sulfurtransferase
MAKKSVKKSKAKVKSAVVPEKSASGHMKTLIIFSLIMVSALVFGVVYSQVKSAQLEKSTNAPAQVNSTVAPGAIQIQDPATNKSYQMDVKPASVSLGNSVTTVAQSAPQQPVPAESPTSTNIPVRCKVYFKAIDSKATIHRMDIEDAKYLYDSGKALFIDARGANEYAEAHIKGSINIPVNTTTEELAKLKDKLQGKLLVTYCHGIGCHLSDKTAYLLFDAGYRKIGIFFGGWPKWNEHKYPIDTKEQPIETKVLPK